ncbi:enolase C-terminal domain-like protein [Negadavirga shengliensis]|uniref:Enolase C-terminal domain-like protein n=1 Tax=Negadavirga shengliensis TaxID=1389218 RepID=A0ABV9SZZ9_9BACT
MSNNLIHNAFKDRNIQILVDSNDMYSLDDTLHFLEGVRDVPVFWVEEPFKKTFHEGRQLKDWMKKNGFESVLYADGEANPDHNLLSEMVDAGILDVYLSDIYDYGFSKWIKLNIDLKEKGTLSSPHAWGNSLKTNYITHLAAAQGNVVTIEGVTCFSDQIAYGDYKISDGLIYPSNAPGFGMTLL